MNEKMLVILETDSNSVDPYQVTRINDAFEAVGIDVEVLILYNGLKLEKIIGRDYE